MNHFGRRSVSCEGVLLSHPAARPLRNALLVGVSAIATGVFAAPALAQQTNAPADNGQEAALDEIVVTGIRASLERAIDIKKNSAGVVDAISAEDIGKFPDTNLAESLQRITGVSIDRSNGEGSEVTVRGFGGGFNLVTLNGRTMPTANVATVGGDQNADTAQGTSRSFDFSNLASEGVSTLEVYKTGRASVPSGGIGAAINVKTRRPLDARESGLSGSIGAKALYDTSVDDAENGMDKVTPEVSGLLTWADPGEKFGVSIFGSYQKRNYTSISATSNAWNIRKYSDFLNPNNGFVRNDGTTKVENGPSDPNALVSVPNDSRYHFAEGKRERLNGQLTLQFRPIETLTLTADAMYARNKNSEQRSDQSNWFNRPFNQVRFSGSPVATTSYLQETINGVKDIGFEQQYRATKDTLKSFGGNATWEVNDRLTLSVDGHHSKSNSDPDNPMGVSSTLVGIGAPVVTGHSVDYSSGFPVQQYSFNDGIRDSKTGQLRGNNNGVLDAGDLGSQVARTIASSQRHRINEIRADASWKLDDGGSKLDFGVDYRDSSMRQRRTQTQQTLGDWGIGNPGDVNQHAGSLIKSFCLTCKFSKFDAKASGPGLIAFRGNAVDLYNALSPVYARQGNAVGVTNEENNLVDEEIMAAYAQLTWKGELAGLPASLVIGARYERTKTRSTSVVSVPDAIIWTSDNDFVISVGDKKETISRGGKYNNFLPAMDFQIELTDNLIGRVSWSKTLARPDYSNLFVADAVTTPPRPIANGGVAGGTTGNAALKPLISDNFDVSLEWYYKPSSYVSVGFFEKRVQNFVGSSQVERELFGLRDPSSGLDGTRSGAAKKAVAELGADTSDVNLFTMTALLQQTGSIEEAKKQFQANYANGSLNQTFVDTILKAVDIRPDATDPRFNFAVNTPVNNREGKIYGFEIAAQHFFGQTGFGVAAAYTMVNGNVGIDVAADPSEDQFALLGLSDTANVTLIYENYGVSARLAYNWRDNFLQQTNRGGNDRNPVFVKSFGQLDLNISYDVTENLAVSLEALNLTKESLETYGRDKTNLWFAQELDRRFLLGARYKF